MAVFRVTAPDGKVYQVTGPDDATEDEILAQIAAQERPATKRPDPFERIAQMRPLSEPAVPAGEAFGRGAMRSWDTMAHGLEQAYLGGKQALGGALGNQAMQQEAQARAAQVQQEEEAQKAQFAQAAQQRESSSIPSRLIQSGAEFAGEVAPYMAAQNPVTAAILAAIGYGTPGERATRAGLTFAGGKAGEKVGQWMSKSPIKDASRRAGLEAAERIGMPVSAGQATGNKVLGYAESGASALPGGVFTMQRVAEAAQAARNRAAAKAIGQEADTLSEEVLAAARTQIGNAFDDLTRGKAVQLTKGFLNKVRATVQSGQRMREWQPSNELTQVAQSIEQWAPAIQNLKNVRIPASDYNMIRRVLNDNASSLYRAGKADAGKAMQKLVRQLDDAMEESLGKAERLAFNEARKQWASLLTLERGSVIEAGNVSAKRLGNAMNSIYRSAYKEGKLSGPLMDVARVGEAFRPLPTSGTAERLMAMAAMTGGTAALGASNPGTVAAAWAAPYAVARGATSPAVQRYLTHGAPQLEPWLTRLGIGGGLLGAGSAAKD